MEGFDEWMKMIIGVSQPDKLTLSHNSFTSFSDSDPPALTLSMCSSI